jgi:hypothetical protein
MITMATKKTSMFTLSERITLTTTGPVFATIDLGSYVDVGDRQALQVHSVDFIFQGSAPNSDMVTDIGNGREVIVQVTDLNRGATVFADDRALVASGRLNISNDANLSQDSDLYPDNFGKGSDDGRYVVNDQLYITGELPAAAAVGCNVTVRVNASIIAIQSTAADN